MNSHNAERDLHRWWKRQPQSRCVCEPFEFRVPLKGGPSTHAALLPHELFSVIHNHSTRLFHHLFTGSREELQGWWSAAAETGDAWYTNHPAIQNCADPARRVPIGIHGDDAGVQGGEKILVLTWGSVVRAMPTLDSRLIFCMLKVSLCIAATFREVYLVLAWSLNALATGIFPDADHKGRVFSRDYMPHRARLAGQPLAGGIIACWSEMRGDWKFLREALLLRRHYNAFRVCHLCGACRTGSNRFTCFGRHTPLRGTRVDPQAWLARQLAQAWSPLLTVIGFCIEHVYFDIMHTFDLGK